MNRTFEASTHSRHPRIAGRGGLASALLAASLGLLASVGLGGCVEAEELDEQGVIEIDEAATSETTQALSVFNWSATSIIDTAMWHPQVATIGNRVFVIHSGPTRELFMRERAGGVNWWTAETVIPGTQTALTRPSLAAFNGYLYMIYSDISVSYKLWVKRFNPATNTWSASTSIPHQSAYGPPAIVAYNGVLQLIGIDPSTKKLWRATMSTSDAFTPAVLMEGHYSYGRVSAAVQGCKMHIVHRAGSGTTVVHNFFNGTAWTYDRTIPAGPGGAAIQAAEPVIAERSGYLHLVHRTTANNTPDASVWWTYYNGSSWPSEVSLPGAASYYPPVLTTGGSGLVLVNTKYYDSQAISMEYAQSLPPYQPLPCVAPPVFL